MIPEEKIEAAIKRIAQTPDGKLLHLGLQRAVMALSPSPEAGALQTFEGGRRFAAKLKALMDSALAETSSATGSDPADRPIVIRPRGPVATGAGRGAARRGGIGNPAKPAESE